MQDVFGQQLVFPFFAEMQESPEWQAAGLVRAMAGRLELAVAGDGGVRQRSRRQRTGESPGSDSSSVGFERMAVVRKARRASQARARNPAAFQEPAAPKQPMSPPPLGWTPAGDAEEFLRRLCAQHQKCLSLIGDASVEELFFVVDRLFDDGELELAWLFNACFPQRGERHHTWTCSRWEWMMHFLSAYHDGASQTEDGARFFHGLCAQFFLDVSDDDEDLSAVLVRALENGSAYAGARLGLCYSHGIFGMKRDPASAQLLLRAAAKAGSLTGMLGVWELLRDNTGDPAAVSEAEYWLGEAVASGDAHAWLQHAWHAVESGKTDAGELVRRYAEQLVTEAWNGDADAQAIQGLWHEFQARDDSSDARAAEHLVEAARWFMMAARSSFAVAWTWDKASDGFYRCEKIDAEICQRGVALALKYFDTPRRWLVPVRVLERRMVIEPLPGEIFRPPCWPMKPPVSQDKACSVVGVQ